jgi:hypothetical protein
LFDLKSGARQLNNRQSACLLKSSSEARSAGGY